MRINTHQDTCACRPCTYPNGIVAVVAQIILVAAFVLSLLAAGDCQFVTVPKNQVNETWLSTIYAEPSADYDERSTERGFGFFFYEDSRGDCSWDRYHNETTFDAYWDYLGRSDWEDASSVALAAALFGFFSLVWCFLFSCIAQPKMVRYSFAAFVLVVMPILQAVPLMSLESEFCNEHSCSLGRSSRSSIAAVVLYFVAGLLLFFTKDWPGHDEGTMPDQNQPTLDYVVDSYERETAPENGCIQGAREVQVEEGMVDVTLVDDRIPTVKAQTY